MKLNKTIMVAALAAAATMATALTVGAQNSTNTAAPHTVSGPAARPAGAFDNISGRLSLSDDQKEKVKPIWLDMVKQMAAIRKDTTLDRPAMMAKRKEIFEATTAKLKDILTPDQLTKWGMMSPGHGPLAPGMRLPASTNTTPAAAKQ